MQLVETMNLLDVARSGPDVMSVLAAMLDASELCRVSLTCKALGGRQAGSDPQGDGLPPIEVAAMRVVEATATDYEKSRCDGFPLSGESWIEVYHRLLRYRATPQLHRLKVLDCCNADVAVERLAEIKDRLVANNQKTQWVPDFVKEKRFKNWLENARDWSVSRNRFWGTLGSGLGTLILALAVALALALTITR